MYVPKQVKASSVPKITLAEIESSQQKIGIKPTISIKSTGNEKVQYRVYLYSPDKKKWEDVSGGYTDAKNPASISKIMLNTALHMGENSFSVWVKRAGKNPIDKGGYDSFLSYKINVSEASLEGDNVAVEVPETEVPEVKLPKIKLAEIETSQQKVGVKPTMSITSTASEKVQYRVYLYSPDKKKWEDVSGGYTDEKDPSKVSKIQLNTALHKGENSFSVWVKRAGKDPVDKGGYDSFLSYRINVTEVESGNEDVSLTLPKIIDVSIDESQIKLGEKPKINLKSNCATNVQYSIYLYSKSKNIWENVSGGYTKSVDPSTPYSVEMEKPLQPGDNTLSIWVKRAGKSPVNSGGYDSYIHKTISVDIDKSKAAQIKTLSPAFDSYVSGQKPEIEVNASTGDNSNIVYKTFIYSDSDKTWIESSNFTNPIESGQTTTIKLDTPLKEGNNKILLWAKREVVSGDVYEDYKIIEINAKKAGPIKKKIVIDPGHGGKDTGAISPNTGVREKDIALIVSLKLGNVLKDNGYEVLYTRTSDDVAWDSSNQNDSLRYRYEFANSNEADIFVAIHCNSFNGKGYGTETLYSKKNPKKDEALAKSLQSEVIKVTGMRDRGIKNGSNWQVVNNTNMPASIVELGFIDNLDDEPKLTSDKFQDKFVQGIYNGIVKYFKN